MGGRWEVGVVVFGTLYSLQYLVNTSKSYLMQTTTCKRQPQSRRKKRSLEDDFSERNFFTFLSGKGKPSG